MLSISHVINPFISPSRQDLDAIQPLVCESMRYARDFCSDNITVDLCGTIFSEDASCFPEGFRRLPNLYRSILDVYPFTTQKKLPLIHDILNIACQNSKADYMVYTNMDIIVMPHFYRLIDSYIRDGFDTMIINRRDIECSENNNLSTLPKIWSAIGQPSAGYDCFVFARKKYTTFTKDMCCIGAAAVDMGIVANMMVAANKLAFLSEEHVTCHIGNDRQWIHEEFDELTTHNYREFSKVYPALRDTLTEKYMPDHSIMERMQVISSEVFPEYIVQHRNKNAS